MPRRTSVPASASAARVREGADADHDARPEVLGDRAQGLVAGREERRALLGRQFVGRAVLPTRLHEHERAVVPYEEAREEALGRLEALLGPTPQARTADLRACAGEALDRARVMLALGPRDAAVDPEPLARERHLAEGDAGLRHAEGTRIHADEQHLDSRPRVTLEEALVRLARIDERVVDVRHRRAELQLVDRSSQAPADRDRRFHTSVAIKKIKRPKPSRNPVTTRIKMRSSFWSRMSKAREASRRALNASRAARPRARATGRP